MLQQIKILTGVQLLGLWNINEARHSKDLSKKRRLLFLLAVWVLVAGLLVFYAVSLSAACISIGQARLIPVFLSALTSLLIFFFSVFYAGHLIFQLKTYNMLSSLPVTPSAIIISRFLTMYMGNLLLSILFMLPGLVLYLLSEKPGLTFYPLGLIGILILPMLPMTLSCIAGAAIIAVSSRMKHKSLVSAGLSLALILVFLGLNMQFSMKTDSLSTDDILQLSGMAAERISSVWPPAALFSKGLVNTDIPSFLLFAGCSAVIFVLFVFLVQLRFAAVCTALQAHTASKTYKLQSLTQSSLRTALYRRELHRYFASSVYIMNTAAGYLMMAAAAAALFIVGPTQVDEVLGLSGITSQAAPLFFAAIGGITSLTACSISMEGKQWWILQSLPLSSKDIFHGKILLQLTAASPFYLITEALLLIRLRPSFSGTPLLLALPAAFILYTAVLGLSMNLRFPVFDWSSETTAVKQSASVLLTMLASFAGFCVPLLLTVAAATGLLPVSTGIIEWSSLVIIVLLTFLLYRRNNQTDLRCIH